MPNLPPAPSARDIEIYKCAVVLRHEQCNIAHVFRLRQPRISQIVAKVRRWLAAGGSTSDPAIRDHFAQQHLSRAKQKMRLQGIIERATYAMENQLPSQVTTKTRYHGMSEFWREETRHLSPAVNMPAMRLLLRAAKTLDDLEARYDEVAPAQKSEPLGEPELFQSVFELLCRWRTRAEATGRLPHSPNIAELIADGLGSLIGTPLDSTGRPAVGQASCLPRNVEQPSCLPINSAYALGLPSPSEPTNTPEHISASSELLVVPTTDQPSPSDK